MSRPSGAVDRAERTDARAAERFPIRAAVAKFLLMGTLALLVVATPVSFWIRSIAEREALDDALVLTQQVADFAIRPLATQALLAGDDSALAAVDSALEHWSE